MFFSKVDIGLQKGEKRMVGYINCTHLHAPEGKSSYFLVLFKEVVNLYLVQNDHYLCSTSPNIDLGDGEIRFEQLNMLTKWIREFQAVTKQDNEMVMFDVLCGDFNFDNCSPGMY